MRFYVITVLPEILESFVRGGLVGKAVETGKISVETISPRELATDRHRTVDDAPYGGGSGMVMMPGPLVLAMEAADARDAAHADRDGGGGDGDGDGEGTPAQRPLRILLSPQGERFSQAIARELAAEQRAITLVCGRYEGVDERAVRQCDREISIGDFVLMGGEVAAMAIVEAVSRLLPGVLGNPDSIGEESHSAGRLEYPHYTRPATFRGESVPDVLVSGHHAEVAKWRRRESLRRTRARRGDLFDTHPPDDEERAMLEALERDDEHGDGR